MPPGVEKKRVAIFDHDPHVVEIIQQYCAAFGYEGVDDCQDAFPFLSSPEQLEKYDLFVIDWAYKGSLSPSAIISRIRQCQETALTPIMILTGLPLGSETSLAKEHFCTEFLEKPMTSSVFKALARTLHKEERWYRENYGRVLRLIQDETLDVREQTTLLLDRLKTSPNPVPFGVMLSDAFAAANLSREAESMLLSLIAHDNHNICALNRLAKLYISIGRHQEAYKVLKAADILNPKNPKRLCALGKIELKNKDCAAAQKSFSRALSLDQHDKAANFGLQLAKTMEEQSQQNPEISLSASYASLLNTMGISMVHQGRLDDAIAHYQQALNYLKCSVLKSKVSFNIGLGYLRHHDLKDAHQWFQLSQEHGKKKFNKAHQYVFRLERYFDKNHIEIGSRQIQLEGQNFLDDDEPLYKGGKSS
ncbi:tetratricopeptide repeat protein [Pseudobacteriovorax antillogorgiicola]|nr:tetratricopeptide repeat protein [Pseudobacteriovorax antillogorgiicola]